MDRDTKGDIMTRRERDFPSGTSVLLEPAVESFRGGRFEKALAEAQGALELGAPIAEAQRLIGWSHVRLGHWDDALSAGRAAEAAEAGPGSMVLQATALAGMNDFRPALEAADRAIAAGAADSSAAWYAKSFAESRLGQHRASRESIQKAIALSPTNPDYLVWWTLTVFSAYPRTGRLIQVALLTASVVLSLSRMLAAASVPAVTSVIISSYFAWQFRRANKVLAMAYVLAALVVVGVFVGSSIGLLG
jgi:tetratricopeptide (TPR) repeat protein